MNKKNCYHIHSHGFSSVGLVVQISQEKKERNKAQQVIEDEEMKEKRH